MKVQIMLKSGASIEVDLEELRAGGIGVDELLGSLGRDEQDVDGPGDAVEHPGQEGGVVSRGHGFPLQRSFQRTTRIRVPAGRRGSM